MRRRAVEEDCNGAKMITLYIFVDSYIEYKSAGTYIAESNKFSLTTYASSLGQLTNNHVLEHSIPFTVPLTATDCK